MRALYDRYRKHGNDRYGEAIGQFAPYFATIDPQFVRLDPGYCERNTRSVHNHIGSIHAVANCNGAELGVCVYRLVPGSWPRVKGTALEVFP